MGGTKPRSLHQPQDFSLLRRRPLSAREDVLLNPPPSEEQARIRIGARLVLARRTIL